MMARAFDFRFFAWDAVVKMTVKVVTGRRKAVINTTLLPSRRC